MKFTDERIRQIFGSYDGEGENIERLKAYYFKNDTYTTILSNLPVRILVGNKGIGKSALFRIALSEQKDAGKLSLLIKPDDIGEIGEKHESLILSIRKWKYGLTDLILKKVLAEVGINDDSISSKIIKYGGKIFSILSDIYNHLKDAERLTIEQKNFFENLMKSKEIIIYIDDIDRGWQNRSEGLILISALINSIRDMSSENPGLQFKLALRTDVFNAVRSEDESSDKFEGLVSWHTYKLHEIFVMLIKRILTFQNLSFDEKNLINTDQKFLAHYLDSIFERTFYGSGKWENVAMYKVLLSLIRSRPRDLVKFCTMAAKEAQVENSPKISTNHIESILQQYSKSIIDDTIAEYKSELPSLERLIYGMKPTRKERSASTSYTFTTQELHRKLFNISQLGSFRFANGKIGTPHDLSQFLYKINFLTARKKREDGRTERLVYEQANHLSSSYLDFGYDWEIHLAYRWMIQGESLNDIFNRLSLD